MRHQPLPLTDLKKLRKAIRSTTVIHREKLSVLDKAALFTTEKVGSMGFFLIVAVWTLFWICWNTFGPKDLRFDTYPAFVLWLFVSNLIQLLLMPLLLVGQNLMNRHSEARAEAEYELNIKEDREIETVIQHLENQDEVLARIEERLEKLVTK